MGHFLDGFLAVSWFPLLQNQQEKLSYPEDSGTRAQDEAAVCTPHLVSGNLTVT